MEKAKENILPKMLPLYKASLEACDFSRLEEIRLRANRPMMIYDADGGKYCGATGVVFRKEDAITPSSEDIRKQLLVFCQSSIYAYQDDLGNGFLTLGGGHRVGVAGTAVIKSEKIATQKDISGLNIRIARAYPGCATPMLSILMNEKRIFSTLILSPPGVGKTTALRDIARQLGHRFRVSIVDERSEIAAMEQGVPSFDIGEQTDVLDAFPKDKGILCALRALSPNVIITDEIGDEKDVYAIKQILKGGAKIITSMHGFHIEEITKNHAHLIRLFERIILLERTKQGVEVAKWEKL